MPLPTTEDIKFFASTIIFFCVMYPLKKIIIPILLIIREQAYLYLSILTGFVLLYLYDYDIDKIIRDFVTKISIEDGWFLLWIFKPLMFEDMLTCPFAIVIFIAVSCSIVKVGSGWIKMFNLAARVVADGILAILYVYYMISGNSELSTICSKGDDERRTKIIVYSAVGILIVLIFTFVALTMKSEMQSTITFTHILLNASFPNETANATMTTLDFIPDLPYQNAIEVMNHEI